MTNAEDLRTAAKREAAARTQRWANRKNQAAADAIVARGGLHPSTDWAAIAGQLRADGKLA